MNIIDEYSKIIEEKFYNNNSVNLFKWNNKEIKENTCDNIHLTEKGSDWIYSSLIKLLNL
tara:strand:+ start:301 stop:480 length:180 start_codon:yes stop_codon:yes gene_type:complete